MMIWNGCASEQQLYYAVVVKQHLVARSHDRQLTAVHELAQKALADGEAVLVKPSVDLIDGTDCARHNVPPFHMNYNIYLK